uniref:Uncharacterized protein n=1 Tax=Oryza meridionalis TaxID=40149 RepID=A0A0E0DZR2_9ORYZ
MFSSSGSTMSVRKMAKPTRASGRWWCREEEAATGKLTTSSVLMTSHISQLETSLRPVRRGRRGSRYMCHWWPASPTRGTNTISGGQHRQLVSSPSRARMMN